jgi:hypothetical protein
MATASVQYTFAPLTDIKSSEANKNFQDLVTFLNNQAIHADASRVFTAIPSGPATNPVSADQFTRKAYVDAGGTAGATVATTQSTTSASFVDLATVGPAVTMTPPASGLVIVSIYCHAQSIDGSQTPAMGFALSGGNVLAASVDRQIGHNSQSTGGITTYQGASFLLTGLVAVSTTFTAKYHSSGGDSATFSNRQIIVWGVAA